MRISRRLPVLAVVTAAVTLLLASPVFACGSLVAANGAVNLVRTSTLAAYHDGVEHYVTSFEFAGEPRRRSARSSRCPAEPSKVERGGDWTLQRLQREVRRRSTVRRGPPPRDRGRAEGVEVLEQVRIDSLDVTILQGRRPRGRQVGERAQGFDLTERHARGARVLRRAARRTSWRRSSTRPPRSSRGSPAATASPCT